MINFNLVSRTQPDIVDCPEAFYIVSFIFSNIMENLESKDSISLKTFKEELKSFSALPLVSKCFNRVWSTSPFGTNKLFDSMFKETVAKSLLDLPSSESTAGREKAEKRIVKIKKILDIRPLNLNRIKALDSLEEGLKPLQDVVSLRERWTVDVPLAAYTPMPPEVLGASTCLGLAATAITGLGACVSIKMPELILASSLGSLCAGGVFLFAAAYICTNPGCCEDIINSRIETSAGTRMREAGIPIPIEGFSDEENVPLLTPATTPEHSSAEERQDLANLIDWVDQDLEVVVDSD